MNGVLNEATTPEPELSRKVLGRIWCFESHGQTHLGLVRARNEDAFIERPSSGLWAVADGMGGLRDGHIASASTIAALHALDTSACLENAVEQAAEALAHVNNLLFDTDMTGAPVTGSTIAVVLARAGKYACMWAGDSRVYMLRDARLTRLTRDHSRSDQTNGSAAQNGIHNAVGVCRKLQLDRVQGDLRPDDHILLCTDGLTNLVSDCELEQTLAAGSKAGPAITCHALVSQALSRGAPDNITAVLLRAGVGRFPIVL